MAPRSTESAIGLPPAEAIAFLRQKTNTTSEHWTDVWQEAHSRAFMVAGAASEALVSDFRAAVQKAIEQGTTLQEFRADFDAIVAKHGWEHNGTPGWRSQIIYETNLSMAYSAGRYAQMTEPDTLKVYPYWQYQHTSSLHPRPQHLAWVGTTLRADDPWWSTHYPPNGWRCRCSVRPVSARDLKRMGKSGPDENAPTVHTYEWTNPRTGAKIQVPDGIDPGFAYNPGRAWLGDTPPASGAPRPPVGPPVGPAAAPPPARLPSVLPPEGTPAARVAPDYADWLDKQATDRRPDGTHRIVGVISPTVQDALEARHLPAAGDAIVLRSSDLQHALRDHKQAAGRGIGRADLAELPRILATPQAVLIERRTGLLLYVFQPGDPAETRLGKIVVAVGFSVKARDKGKRGREQVNAVRSAGLVPLQALANRGEYELIDGSL